MEGWRRLNMVFLGNGRAVQITYVLNNLVVVCSGHIGVGSSTGAGLRCFCLVLVIVVDRTKYFLKSVKIYLTLEG